MIISVSLDETTFTKVQNSSKGLPRPKLERASQRLGVHSNLHPCSTSVAYEEPPELHPLL